MHWSNTFALLASEKASCIVDRLWTVAELAKWIPGKVAVNALTMIVKCMQRHERGRIGEDRRGIFENDFVFCCEMEEYHLQIWVTLISVVIELGLRYNGSEISSAVDGLALLLRTAMEQLDEREIVPVYVALSQCVIKKTSTHFEELHAVSRRRLLCLRRERDEEMAKFVIRVKTAFPHGRRYEFDEYGAVPGGWDGRTEQDWVEFILLSCKVMSAEDVPDTLSALAEEVMNTIAFFSRKEIGILAQAISSVDVGSEKEEEVCLLFEDKIRDALAGI